MSLHAVEITLLRPMTKGELKVARHNSRLPLAASADRIRLLTLVGATNRAAALRAVWAALDDLLPIDTLCTAHADADGMHLLSVQLSDGACARVHAAAAVTGQAPDEYVTQAVLASLARHQASEAERLGAALDRLMSEFTAAQITVAAARMIAPEANAPAPNG